MEQIRTIRLVLGPFILLGSLLLGAWLDGTVTLEYIRHLETSALTAIGGIVAAAIVPVGWVIGGITTFLLFVIHKVTPERWDRFEVCLSAGAWERIWKTCAFKSKHPNKDGNFKSKHPGKDERLWGAVIWVRSKVKKEIYEVTHRRYEAAVSQLNATTAILLSYGVGWVIKIGITWQWILCTVPAAFLFLALAIISRLEASHVLELMAHQSKEGAGLEKD